MFFFLLLGERQFNFWEGEYVFFVIPIDKIYRKK